MPRVPFFYIIRNVNSGIMYAGSKWGRGCNPETFMTTDGYTTSSTIINNIIEKDGLEAFEVLRVDTYCNNMPVYDYESLFLQTTDCARSDAWYNTHNNAGMAFGTPKFFSLMMEKYGTYHCSKLPDVRRKARETKKIRYGSENYSNREKTIATCQRKYGVDSPMKVEAIKEKLRQVFVAKYGCVSAFSIPEVYEKYKSTMHNRYGVYHPMQVEEIKRRYTTSMISNHGVEHNSQMQSVKDSKRVNSLLKYGVENVSQAKVIKDKKKETCMRNFGVENSSQIPRNRIKASINMKKMLYSLPVLTCSHCGKEGKGGNMTRWHFDNCRYQ